MATTGMDLWNSYAANPDDHANIPNVSYAGYHRGDRAIPDVPVVADLAEFGGVGDGVTDNSGAFAAAIEAAYWRGGGAVNIGLGIYRVDKFIHLHRSGVVLRGAGPDLTTIQFTGTLSEVLGGTYLGGLSKYNWSGGLIWVSPFESFFSIDITTHKLDLRPTMPSGYLADRPGQNWEFFHAGSTLTNVLGTAERGVKVLTVADASQLKVGETYILAYDLPSDLSFHYEVGQHALLQDPAAWGTWITQTAGYPQWQWPVEIAAITGNEVTLAQPLRVAVRPQWNVRFKQMGLIVEESGVENLAIQGEMGMAEGINSGSGWNAIYFTNTLNCWARNVKTRNMENGFISAGTKGTTILNTEVGGENSVHHPYASRCETQDMRVDDFAVTATLKAAGTHGINTEWFAAGNVWSRGTMLQGTLDSHRGASFDYVRTAITVANNKESNPGGSSSAGPYSARRSVHWNILIDGSDRPPQDGLDATGLYVFQPDNHVYGTLVGIRGAPECQIGSWAMPHGNKEVIVADAGLTPAITNLYDAQVNLRRSAGFVSLDAPPMGLVTPGTQTLTATAQAPTGRSINRVEFYVNGSLAHTDTSAPYTYAWSATLGAYQLHARMVDDMGSNFDTRVYPVTCGRRVRYEEDNPALTYSGNWTTVRQTDSYGSAYRRTVSSSQPGTVDLTFRGTRAQIIAYGEGDNHRYYVYMDDMANAVANIVYYGNPVRVRHVVWDSGILPDGVHTLRLSGYVGGCIFLDAIEVDSTDPAITSPLNPIARFTASTNDGYMPLPVTFDASASLDDTGAAGLTYTWDFGDGTTGTGQITSHTYTTRSTGHTAILTVTDAFGHKDRASTIIKVRDPNNAKPVARFTSSTLAGTARLTVNFDASASSDSDGTVTSYLWDFGDGSTASGVQASHTFVGPGVYPVALTVVDEYEENSVPAVETILVTEVSQPAPGVYQESAGMVVIEAEQYQANSPGRLATHLWQLTDEPAGYSGTGAMAVLPADAGGGQATDEYANLQYRVNFTHTGRYYIWARGGSTGTGSGIHMGLDGDAFTYKMIMASVPFNWMSWQENNQKPAVDISIPGEHVINIWMRFPGTILDKLVFTTDNNYTPTGAGPATSAFVAANQPPGVFLLAPADGSVLDAGSPVLLSAVAADGDAGDSVAKVEFYDGAQLLGEDTSAPYGFVWASPPLNQRRTLIVRAYDQHGAVGQSGAHIVTFSNNGNQPPAISLTAPSDGASYSSPATVSMAVSAGDPDGSLTRVDYFVNGQLVGSANAAPWSCDWLHVMPGNYTLHAVAFDNAGASGVSSTRVISVSGTPNQAPAAMAGADVESTGAAYPLVLPVSGGYTDDGLPGGPVSFTWTSVTGPVTPVIADPGAASTTISFPQAGRYQFRFSVNDGAASAADFIDFNLNEVGLERTYLEFNGSLSIEAESYRENRPNNDATGVVWKKQASTTGFSGSGYMNNPGSGASGAWGTASELRYRARITNPGTYYLYVRRCAPDTGSNSLFWGVDGIVKSGIDNDNGAVGSGFSWKLVGNATLSAGEHTISFQRREWNYQIDKFILSTSATPPTGTGAPESAYEGGPLMVRLDSPQENQEFISLADITLATTVGGGQRPIQQVEFFRDGVSVGVDTTAPYSITLLDQAAGTYAFTARVTDAGNTVVGSGTRFTLVKAPANPGNATFVSYLGVGANTELFNAYQLSDGTVLMAGRADNLGWVPAGVAVTTLPATGINNSTTGSVGFMAHFSADLQTLLRIVALPPGAAINLRHLRGTEVPGAATGALHVSGLTSSGYFIGRLNHNFVTGVPTAFSWVYNSSATGDAATYQSWDVGNDGRVVLVKGGTTDASVEFLDASGQTMVLPQLRATHVINGVPTQGIAAQLGGGISASRINIPADVRSWTEADRIAILPDGNDGLKMGMWPVDFVTQVYSYGGSSWGYTGYRSNGNYRVVGCAVDRRNNDFYIGFNIQTVFYAAAQGVDPTAYGPNVPDFEPAVIAYAGDGSQKWWSRLYSEAADADSDGQIIHTPYVDGTAYNDPANAARIAANETSISAPDQYVDGLAVDYSNGLPTSNTVVVLGRSHGNWATNLWRGDAIAANPGAHGFQNQVTGTDGNVHLSWLGRLRASDGALLSATTVAGYYRMIISGKGQWPTTAYTDPLLDGWPDHNTAWPDLTTTMAEPNSVGVDAQGRVYLVGAGPRMVTTANAWQKLPRRLGHTNPVLNEGTSPWSAFARIYTPAFDTLAYSSALTGVWTYPDGNLDGSPDGADNTDLRGVLPTSTGLLVIGRKRAGGNDVKTTVAPAWGEAGANGGSAALIARLDADLLAGAPNRSPVAEFSLALNDLLLSVDASASSDPDGNIVAWRWGFGDGATASGITANHTFADSTQRRVWLIVEDNKGATAMRVVDVQPGNLAPTATLTAPANGATVDRGLPLTLTATGSDPDGTVSRMEFNVNGTRVGTDAVGSDGWGYSWTPAEFGTFFITATAVDNENGTGSSAPVSITVADLNTPPTISAIADQSTFEDTASAPIAFTVGDAETAAASLLVSAASANPALVPPGSIVFSGTGASRSLRITPASGVHGFVTITVTVSDGRKTAQTQFQLQIIHVESPLAPSVLARSGAVTALVGQPVSLAVQASGNPAPAYQWRKGGVAIPGATGATLALPAASLADSGSYDCVVTNSQGSAASVPAAVTVVEQSVLRVRSVGVNFMNTQPGGTQPILAAESAGVEIFAGWNNLPGFNGAAVTDNTGAAAGTLSVGGAAGGTYPSTAVTYTNPNAKLLGVGNRGNKNTTDTMTVTIGGLPAVFTGAGLGYSVIVYFVDGQYPTADTNQRYGYTLTASGYTGTTTYYASRAAFDPVNPAFTRAIATSAAGAPAATYARWDGLTAAGFTVTCKAESASTRVLLSGVQVVAMAPAPATLVAPGGLAAAALDPASAVLSWNDPNNAEEGYRVERATDGVTFTEIASLPVNAAWYVDTARPAGQDCQYRVRAAASGSFSAYSGTASVAAESAFAAWLAGYPGLSDTTPDGDPDHDGIPNLIEYALSLDPTAPSQAGLPAVQLAAIGPARHLQLSFRCDAARADLTYVVQAADDLATSGWTDIARSTGGGPTISLGGSAAVSDTGTGQRTVTVTDATPVTPAAQRFLRLSVEAP